MDWSFGIVLFHYFAIFCGGPSLGWPFPLPLHWLVGGVVVAYVVESGENIMNA